MEFKDFKKIHIIGNKGIGISALAKVLAAKGIEISGSDIETGGHSAANVPSDADLVIYSNAIPADNIERKKARELGIKEMSYPEALAEFIKGKKVIAVAGTNGKTTTTAMIGWIMEAAGLDPTVIVGSRVLAWDSNARVGNSEWVVIEADEYKRAFLNYHPDIAVITNIAKDHLDYYKDLADIQSAFSEFEKNLKPGGVLVKYSPADAQGMKLLIPGKFNFENAAAAASVANYLKINPGVAKQALETFTGTWRRFERAGKFGNTEIISDYAHHPDAIRVTLQAACEAYLGKKILAVFQPHQHNRTKKLFPEFVSSFCESPVNDFIISEIFEVSGREAAADQDISSKDLVEKLTACGKNAIYAGNLDDCGQKVKRVINNYDVIIFIGAGDIYKIPEKLVANNK